QLFTQARDAKTFRGDAKSKCARLVLGLEPDLRKFFAPELQGCPLFRGRMFRKVHSAPPRWRRLSAILSSAVLASRLAFPLRLLLARLEPGSPSRQDSAIVRFDHRRPGQARTVPDPRSPYRHSQAMYVN